MPTTVTKTVGPGKDYANLTAAISGEARNLVTANEICDLVCYSMVQTTAFGVGGFTTDATRYVRIRVNSADRHDGTRSPGKFWIHANVDFSEAFNIGCDYTRIEGFQVTNDPSNGTGILIDAIGVRIIDTLVYDCGSRGIAGADGHAVAMNNVAVMNCGGYGIGRTGALDGLMACNNCTVVNCSGAGFVGYTPFGNVTTLKNCYSGGNGGDDYDDANGITLTTCFSEDGSAGSSVAAYSINSGARFLSVTDGSEDVHHTGSSSLRHAGTDLTADTAWVHPGGAVDIDGDARGTTWDVGVDQSPPDAVTNTLAPTIAGTAFTGDTLTATGGVWVDADSTTGKWQRETGIGTGIYVDISAATSLTYVVQAADSLLRVRYLETATNISGSTSVPSDPSSAVGTSLGTLTGYLELASVFGFNLPEYEYVLQPEDAMRRIVFVETATNEAGSTDHESVPFGPADTGLGVLDVALWLQSDVTVETAATAPVWSTDTATFVVLLA